MDFQSINDHLHEALSRVNEFEHGDWVLRCVEFHLGKRAFQAGDKYPWHVHNELQIEWPVSGCFQFTCKGTKPVMLRLGSAYAIPPETSHRWSCISGGLMFGITLTVRTRLNASFHSKPARISPSLFTNPQLKSYAKMLMAEFDSNLVSNLSDRLVCWIYLVVTSALAQCLPTHPAAGSQPELKRSQRIVGKLMRYIDANMASPLSLDRFSKQVDLSPRHINRLFVEVTGSSAHNYVMQRRLEVARDKLTLVETSSVKEICYTTGFTSPAHFSSSFKKKFGISPSAFRANSGANILPTNTLDQARKELPTRS